MVEFKNITFIYDNKPLIEHFSDRIETGEKVVLYGPSGSGKSTMLASIAGFVRPDAGNLYIDNIEVNPGSINHIRQQIAWVPQEFTLPYQTVLEMIETPFLFRINRKKKPCPEEILYLFEKLGLEEEIIHKRMIEISGGQRQRLMLVIAGLLDKEILLLDEPTSALDEDSIQKVISFIREMESKTVISVSHDPRFISSFDHKIEIRN